MAGNITVKEDINKLLDGYHLIITPPIKYSNIML